MTIKLAVFNVRDTQLTDGPPWPLLYVHAKDVLKSQKCARQLIFGQMLTFINTKKCPLALFDINNRPQLFEGR